MTPAVEALLRRKIWRIWQTCQDCRRAVIPGDLPCETCVREAVALIVAVQRMPFCLSCGVRRPNACRGVCVTCYRDGKHLLFPKLRRGPKAGLAAVA